MPFEVFRFKREGRPPKKGKATDSLEGIKFSWRRIPVRRGRPKEKRGRALRLCLCSKLFLEVK